MRAFTSLLVVAWKADPPTALATIVFTVWTNASTVVSALLLKEITDAVVQQDSRSALVWTFWLIGTIGSSSLTGWAAFSLRMRMRERAGVAVESSLAGLTASIHTLEPHERPDYQDEMGILLNERTQLANFHDALLSGLIVVVRLVATVLVLGRVHPALLLLPVFGLPSLAASGWVARERDRHNKRLQPWWRMQTWLLQLAAAVNFDQTAEAPREARMFGLQNDLLRRFDESNHVVHGAEQRLGLRASVVTALGWLCFGVAFVAALLIVARQVIRGDRTAGDLVLALTLASQINTEVAGLAQMVSWLTTCMKTAGRYAWLRDIAISSHRIAHPASPAPVPDRLEDGIRFHDVSFRYPATDRDVLSGVDLYLPARSTVAIVGDNGAGKTTLVKLLCRFYEPTTGTITVDGTDICAFDVDEWRSRGAACFQDFAKFEFRAESVVGCGDLPRVEDRVAVEAALDRAYATDVVSQLPDGLDTQLGRSFDAGVQLSGGQWQKLALGRSMMREEPLLLMLDEPTAALDAPTEHALFERYAGAAARAADRSGAITLLVSHRFSTVRMADLIVVVNGGRIVEQGNHSELIALGGLYAELYELQARAYR